MIRKIIFDMEREMSSPDYMDWPEDYRIMEARILEVYKKCLHDLILWENEPKYQVLKRPGFLGLLKDIFLGRKIKRRGLPPAPYLPPLPQWNSEPVAFNPELELKLKE